MSTLTLHEVGQRVARLPAMQPVRAELLNCLTQEEVDLHRVIGLVGRDPALAASTLRLANSSFFGLPHQVDSVSQALALLGFRSLQSIVLTAAVVDHFKGSGEAGGFDEQACWRHSMAVALCAQALAPRAGVRESAAFTAGLLHDIGRLVLRVVCPQALEQVAAHSLAHDTPWLVAERAVLGFDHAQVGGLLARQWHLPQALCDALALHHDCEHPQADALVWLVHVADALAHALDLAGDPHECVPDVQARAWNGLGLDWGDSTALLSTIETRYHQACAGLVT
jgi:putative nucleotidyltransferase with HDIG domain